MDSFSLELDSEQWSDKEIDGFVGTVEEKTIEAFRMAGTFFMGNAKETKQFKDQTGNLKASIGFVIGRDGVAVDENYVGGEDNDEGVDAAIGLGKQILAEEAEGIVLIGLAGMDYGVYVEQIHHLSVISQSIPETEALLDKLTESMTHENGE